MASLRYSDELGGDVERITEHLLAHKVERVDERLGEIFEALVLLTRHPMIGRPVGDIHRELIIGEGSRGYVALYRYDELDDIVVVMALRAQRESGFSDR